METNLVVVAFNLLLENIPRLNTCTEMDNVALTHAIDKVSFHPTEENYQKLLKEIKADKQWNPGCYKN